MAVAAWQPGTLYQPGALVTRAVAPPVVSSQIPNGDFEDGDTDWTKGSGWTIVNGEEAFTGTWSGKKAAGSASSELLMTTAVPVTPGQTISAHASGIRHGHGGAPAMRIRIKWYTSGMSFISQDEGNIIGADATVWRALDVTGTAPVTAAFAKLAVAADSSSISSPMYVDTISWDYVYSPPPEGLLFRAVQTNAGFSGNVEPVWPTSVGNQVVDNQVTWEAVLATQVVWEASPILVSGSTEPDFPTVVGGIVADNTIIWKAISGRIEDAKCPNNIPTAIAASKVFCGDDDIIRFSATVNPLDWTTADDAGYLPFGLQTFGSQPVTALGLFRSNLVAFNAAGFQMWQVDEDPASMSFLDSVPVSCTFPLTVLAIGDALAFLNSKGVRDIGISPGNTTLKSGVIGAPIDPLVQPQVKAGTYEPFSLFWPFMNQYWLVFGPQAFVLTVNGGNKSWSRYVFPSAITDWTLNGDDLLLRSGALVWRLDEDTVFDDLSPVDVDMTQGNDGNIASFTALSPSSIAVEDTPEALAFSPDGNYAYCALIVPNKIQQMSVNADGTFTNLSPATVSVPGNNTRGVVLRPDGAYLYAPVGASGEIAQYSVSSSTGKLTALVPASISVGSERPFDMAVNAAGTFGYTANATTSVIGQFAIAGNGLLSALSPATVGSPGNSSRVRIHPSGSYLYSIHFGSARIGQFSINPSTGKLTALSPDFVVCGNNPTDMVFTPDGTMAFVSNYNDDTVSQYTISSGLLSPLASPIATSDGPNSLAISPDGLILYVSCAPGKTVNRFNITPTGLEIATNAIVSVESGATYNRFYQSPDGAYAYILNYDKDRIDFFRAVNTPAGKSGYTAIDDFGTVVDTALLNHTLLEAVYDASTDEFYVTISDIDGDLADAFSFTTISIDGLSVVSFSTGDAEIDSLGSVDIGSTTYENVYRYTWSFATNPLELEFSVGFTDLADEPTAGVDIQGIIHWPFLDLGAPGKDKNMVGLDLVSNAPEGVLVSVGFNQNDVTIRTPDYQVDADTLTGMLIPFPVTAPTFDLRLTFNAGQQWEWQEVVLYLNK